jgi:hypothetical protein
MIGEQGLWLRRSSLALYGLADTSFSYFWDAEFTIRLTAGRARIAWYTGKTWEHILQPSSISLHSPNWKPEAARVRQMYPNLYSKWRHYVPKPIRNAIRAFIPKKRLALSVEEADIPTFLY